MSSRVISDPLTQSASALVALPLRPSTFGVSATDSSTERGLMIAVELGGWLAASRAGLGPARVWRAAAGRIETVARACQELRGPLSAITLGLDYGGGNGELTARPAARHRSRARPRRRRPR